MEMKVRYHDPLKGGAVGDKEDTIKNAARAILVECADDGQQFEIMLLDADDSFDIVITYPNGQAECVWSLVREREGQNA